MKNSILRIVFNADLRCSHEGLALIAKDLKINVDKLDIGEYIVILNAKKTLIKIYAAGNVIAFYKSPHGQINVKTLKLIPKYFNGRALQYDDALSEIIRKEIKP